MARPAAAVAVGLSAYAMWMVESEELLRPSTQSMIALWHGQQQRCKPDYDVETREDGSWPARGVNLCSIRSTPAPYTLASKASTRI